MAYYYFHLENSGGRLVDEEGLDLPNQGEAREHALRSIRDLLSEELRHGGMDLRGHIEVRSEDGSEDFSIDFAEAFTMRR